MGNQKYGEAMQVITSIRLTRQQSNSLTAVAHAMSLTVGDTLRFAVDELIEDIPEPRLFTRKVRVQFK